MFGKSKAKQTTDAAKSDRAREAASWAQRAASHRAQAAQYRQRLNIPGSDHAADRQQITHHEAEAATCDANARRYR